MLWVCILWLALASPFVMFFGESLTILSGVFFHHDLGLMLCTSGFCTASELHYYHPTCNTHAWNASRATAAMVASLLARGELVGVVAGRQALGPHPLGRRTVFAVLQANVKDRFSLVSSELPTIVCTPDTTREIFHTPQRLWSPTAAIAFPVKQKFRATMQTYGNGAAVVQTVEKENNPWLYDVLQGLRRDLPRSVTPALQSVNIIREMAQELRAVVRLVCNPGGSMKVVDHLLVEEYLFSRPCENVVL